MRLLAAAQVVWPTREQLDARWRDEVASLDATTVDAQGYLIDPEVPDSDDRVRLTRGTHLAPGAAYVLESSGLDGVDATGEISGEPGRRILSARLRGQRRALGLGPASVIEGEVGLDRLEGLDVRSTNPYLSGSARLRPDPAAPAEARVRLRWLAVDFRALVRPGSDGDELVAELRLRARGAWSPAVAPVVAVVGRFARGTMDDTVRDWAEMLTALAEEREPEPSASKPEWQQTPQELRRFEERALWVRNEAARRFHDVQGRVDQESWWGQRGAAWRRVYAELPRVTWPERAKDRPAWAAAVDEAADKLSRTARRSRRASIESIADDVVRAELWGRRELAPVPDEPDVGAVALRAEDLELSWLRSPLTVWRHLRTAGQLTAADESSMPTDAEDPGYDPAPQAPGS